MLKVTKIVWCSSPEQFLLYKNASPENQESYTSLAHTNCDMTEYGWVKVGMAEISFDLYPLDDGIAAALAGCDKAEAKLREELNDKLAGILEIRQKLLCLPAPKEPFDE